MSKSTAIVYCRTSTKGQRDEKTIEAQIAWAKDAVQRDGVKLLPYGPQGNGWLKDDGVSGSLLAGREFARLIDEIERGKVKPDYVYAYSLSRIDREDRSSKDKAKRIQSRIDAARIAGVLAAYGVMIRDGNGTKDPNSLAYDVERSVSTEEYRGIRDKTMRGKARVLGENVIATGGRPPYGYARVPIPGRKKGTTYAEHPVEGLRFRRVMSWYIDGGASHASRKAMAEGWESPRGSKTWYPSTVQQLLENVTAYLGETTRTVDGRSFTVTYPALLDHSAYAAITRRMKERTLPRRTTLLSTGFTDCSCGAHVHGHRSQSTGEFVLICGRRAEDGLHRHSCGSVREGIFISSLWIACVARLIQIYRHEKVTKNGKDAFAPRLSEARGKLARVQEQLDEIVRLYTEMAIDKDALGRNNERLRAEKITHRAEVERIERDQREHKQRIADQQSVESRVEALLQELVRGTPTVERRREVLADLLQGGRIIVSEWTKKGALFALPAFGTLAPIALRTNEDVWTAILGTSKQKVHVRATGIRDPDELEAQLRANVLAHEGKVISRVEHEDRIEIVYEVPDE